jgi:hypothetical protein
MVPPLVALNSKVETELYAHVLLLALVRKCLLSWSWRYIFPSIRVKIILFNKSDWMKMITLGSFPEHPMYGVMPTTLYFTALWRR